MRKSKFTESQFMDAVKRVEAGFAVPDICRDLGISTATFLQVAGQVQRHGRVDDVAHERGRRRESTSEEDEARGEAQGRERGGGLRKKVVRPSHQLEMAKRAVSECGVEGVPNFV